MGNPYLFDRNLNDLFGGTASGVSDGTVIVGKTGSAEFKSASGLWEGDLKMLKAGEGYIIKNPSTAAFNLVFPAETTLTPGNDAVPSGVKGINAPGWHLHFRDTERRHGGHVVNFSLLEGELSLCHADDFQIHLPPATVLAGLDTKKDWSNELKRAEAER